MPHPPHSHLESRAVVSIGFPNLVADLAAAALPPSGLLLSVPLQTGCKPQSKELIFTICLSLSSRYLNSSTLHTLVHSSVHLLLIISVNWHPCTFCEMCIHATDCSCHVCTGTPLKHVHCARVAWQMQVTPHTQDALSTKLLVLHGSGDKKGCALNITSSYVSLHISGQVKWQ